MKTKYILVVIFTFLLIHCNSKDTSKEKINFAEFWGKNPWPEIRKKRINTLLPKALKEAKVDCWVVICRENNNDPLADHIGGENAGGTAAFLFYNDDEGFHSLVFSPSGESTALDELDIHDKVIAVERGTSAIKQAVDFIKEKDFTTIAVNSSNSNSTADGLTYTQRMELENYLGDNKEKLVSSTEVV